MLDCQQDFCESRVAATTPMASAMYEGVNDDGAEDQCSDAIDD